MKFQKMLATISALTIMFTSLATLGYGSAQKPAVYFSFDDTLKDSSGNGFEAKMTGKVLFTKGVKGNSAEFKGGFLEILKSDVVDLTKAFSLSVWIKQNPVLESANPIFFKPVAEDLTKPVAYYGLTYGGITPVSLLTFGEDYGNNYVDTGSTKELAPASTVEKWCHLAYVFDGKQQNFYVDGLLTDSIPVSDEILTISSTLNNSSKNIFIGKGYDVMFQGMMDELKIFDYAISDEDVSGLYSSIVPTYKNKIILQLDNPEMFIDDTKVEIDPGRGTVPALVEGRTLVPVRAVIEAMGGQVEWIGAESKINITLKSNIISLTLNKLTAKVNGTDMKLDVPPQIINGRTMLPLRFASENLGAKVDWDNDSRKITINYTK